MNEKLEQELKQKLLELKEKVSNGDINDNWIMCYKLSSEVYQKFFNNINQDLNNCRLSSITIKIIMHFLISLRDDYDKEIVLSDIEEAISLI